MESLFSSLESRSLFGSEVSESFLWICASECIEFRFLKGGQAFNFGELSALKLTFLIGFAGGAIALEGVSTEDVIGTGLSFGLFDDIALGDDFAVVMDEGDFFAVEPSGFCFHDAIDSANGEFASPEAILGEGENRGGGEFWFDEGDDLRCFFRFGESVLHAGEKL